MANSKKADNYEAEDSVEDILSEIKNVISGKKDENIPSIEQSELDEEILDLSEIAIEDEVVSVVIEEESVKKNQSPEEDDDEFVDVLQEIDNSIEDDDILENSKKVEIVETKIVTELKQEENNMEQELQNPIIEEETMDLDAMFDSPVQPSEQDDMVIEEQIEDIKEESSMKDMIAEAKQEIIDNSQTSKVEESLISSESVQKSSAAIKGLMNSIPKQKLESPEFRSGVSVEDLVRESLAPMLKNWLDENLETVVRDIVEKEIKKILPRD